MFPRKMARTRQQMLSTSTSINKQTEEHPHNRRFSTISKVGTLGIREARNPPSLTSQHDGSLKDQIVQQEKSIALASMKKNKVASARRTPTSQRTENKPMVERTRWTYENSMVVGMQRTGVSSMAIGAQWTGINLRTGTVHSRQQDSIKTQWVDVNLGLHVMSKSSHS